MLRTNISTRPFYNDRLLQAAIAALLVVVVAVTAFNAIRYIRLSSAERTLGANAADAEANAARLRSEAAVLVGRIDAKQLAAVAAEAKQANALIGQRTFSWTALLAQFETLLPDDVRITSVQPRLEQNGTFVVGLTVKARRVEDLDAFIEALESRGSFKNVLPVEEQTADDGLLEAVIEGVYEQPAGEAQPAPPAVAQSRATGGSAGE
jgi:type IV pilus assembly protein PilN